MPDNVGNENLLEAAALNHIGSLEILSTRVVDGILAGRHRSAYLGRSFEFASHRAYAPGDEIRMIDWKVFARRDRYHIRQFEKTSSLQALTIVDSSGSMDFGRSTVSKLDYARHTPACLD